MEPGRRHPLPNAQTGANGHISHLQQRPSEHKQLCLPPQPLGRRAEEEVKSECVMVIIMFCEGFAFTLLLCASTQSR